MIRLLKDEVPNPLRFDMELTALIVMREMIQLLKDETSKPTQIRDGTE